MPSGQPGKFFNQGGDGKLAAGLVAFKHEGAEIGTACIDRRREAGAAGAEDNEVARFGGHGP